MENCFGICTTAPHFTAKDKNSNTILMLEEKYPPGNTEIGLNRDGSTMDAIQSQMEMLRDTSITKAGGSHTNRLSLQQLETQSQSPDLHSKLSAAKQTKTCRSSK